MKIGWGLGLAAAGMVVLATHARAQSGKIDPNYGNTPGDWSSTKTSETNHGDPPTTRDTASSDTSTMGTGSGSKAAAGHFDTLKGKVQNFDRSDNTLTLAGSDKQLKVDSSTEIMKDGARASVDDIKEGDDVRASYSGTGDTLNVQRLYITSSGAAGRSGGSDSSTGSGSMK